MVYQTLTPMTKPTQKQRTFTKNNFAEHNYNYVIRPQTTKTPRTNTQNHLFSQRKKFPTTTITLSKFNEYPQISQDQSENHPFFSKIKTIDSKTKINMKHLITHLNIFHHFITKIIKNFYKTKDSTLITYINKIFLNHIHKNNRCDNRDQI